MFNLLVKDFQFGVLASSITSGATSLSVATGQGSRFDAVPAGSTVYGVLIDFNTSQNANYNRFEIVQITLLAGDTFTVVRAQEGTSALNFPIQAGDSAALVKFFVGDTVGNLRRFVHGQGAIIQATAPTLTSESPEGLILTPAAPITQALPTTNVWANRRFTVVNLGAAANTITINASGGGLVGVLPGGRICTVRATKDAPTLGTDWVIEGLVAIGYGADTGAANAYIVAPFPAPASLYAGLTILMLVGASNTNTAAATVNPSSLGATTIGLPDGSPLQGGEMVGGHIAVLVYNGSTQFDLIDSMLPPSPAYTLENLIENPDGEIATLGAEGSASFTNATTPANSTGTYLLDQIVHLSDTNNVANVAQETTVIPAGSTNSIKFTQVTINKKYGVLFPVPSWVVKKIRSQAVSLSFQARTTGGAVINKISYGIVEWTGTADAFTKTAVANGSYGAQGVFPTFAASYNVLGSTLAQTLGTAFSIFKKENVTVGASSNNLCVAIFIDDTDGAVNDLLYISQVQLHLGAVAKPYRRRDLNETRFKCYPYLRKSYPPASAPGAITTTGCWVWGGINDATNPQTGIRTDVPHMRAAPTVTVYSTNNAGTALCFDRTTATNKNASSGYIAPNGFAVTCTGVIATGDIMEVQYVANAQMGV